MIIRILLLLLLLLHKNFDVDLAKVQSYQHRICNHRLSCPGHINFIGQGTLFCKLYIWSYSPFYIINFARIHCSSQTSISDTCTCFIFATNKEYLIFMQRVNFTTFYKTAVIKWCKITVFFINP